MTPPLRQTPFQYRIEFGSYSWYGHSGKMESMSDEVAVVFDDDPHAGPVLLKHGSPSDIKVWWDTARARATSKDEFAFLVEHWKVVEGKLDVTELNKAIANSGYRPSFLEKA